MRPMPCASAMSATRHREEAAGRRGDPGPPQQLYDPWIATPSLALGLAMTASLDARAPERGDPRPLS